MYMDLEGTMEGVNHNTGDKIKVTLHTKTQPIGRISGKCHDARGRLTYEIEGHWSEDVFIKNSLTGEREKVWSAVKLHEVSKREFYFAQFVKILNHLPDEVAQAKADGIGLIAPTDSRFRPD